MVQILFSNLGMQIDSNVSFAAFMTKIDKCGNLTSSHIFCLFRIYLKYDLFICQRVILLSMVGILSQNQLSCQHLQSLDSLTCDSSADYFLLQLIK